MRCDELEVADRECRPAGPPPDRRVRARGYLGARNRYVFGEVWIRNAFDTHYIPVAFAYGPLAPSGYIGEMGRPRTFGVSAGVTF